MRRLVLSVLLAAGCGGSNGAPPTPTKGLPPDPPAAIAPLVGDYATGPDTVSVRERNARLEVVGWRDTANVSAVDPALLSGGSLTFGGRSYHRLALGPAEGNVFRITPRKTLEELRRDALAATPPAETGDFLPTDLVELVKLDPTIKLDIRYATTDNFMSAVFYSSARAFLQRPAAEALVRAHKKLATQGFGLLIHDGYRPWYVTKMFWDATPDALRIFVADPSQGSRHNRGCAVDLTMYDLKTGKAVVMPGVYDEMSARSFPNYPGGTSHQRALRSLLRQAMEAEGFTVYEAEWWHFDYKDWRRYHIGNVRFEEIN